MQGLSNHFRRLNAYIAAQGPLESTVEDFWRMVWEHNASIIVMLTKAGRDRCCLYWPEETGVQYDRLLIDPVAEYNMQQYILREFKATDVQVGMK